MNETPTEVENKRLKIIRALLAQAEHTTHPEEARTFSEAAQRKMVEWAIDDATLRKAGAEEVDTIGITEIWIPANEFRGPKTDLLNYIALNNDARMVRYPQTVRCMKCDKTMWGKSAKDAVHWGPDKEACPRPMPKRMVLLKVAGFARDRHFIEVLYTSLLIQAEREFQHPSVQQRMAAESPGGNHAGGAHIRWRNAFMGGYAYTIYDRLSQMRRKIVNEAEVGSPGVGIVLADRSKRVSAAMGDLFGTLGRGKGHGAGKGGGSGRAFGADAASRADLGRPQTGTGVRGVLGG